jgi:hypothetical protein
LSYRPSSLTGRDGTTTLLQSRFLAPINCSKFPAVATLAGGIDSLDSTPWLLKSLKIPSHDDRGHLALSGSVRISADES